MNNFVKTIAWLLLSVIIFAFSSSAGAADSSFPIFDPIIPAPPKIVSVFNSPLIPGEALTVYANISGEIQKGLCCNGVCQDMCEPNCDISACGLEDFYFEKDLRVVPNPTCIPNTQDSSGGDARSACEKSSISNPLLYYYFQGDPASAKSVGMTYDATTGYFTGEIPQADMALNSPDDDLVYYIIATDNRGNVVSQVPSIDGVPCSSAVVNDWVATLATPSIDNCSAMSSYERCSSYKSGNPTCGSGNSLNDPAGDTCDENLIVRSGQTQRDIVGFSAGIGTGFSELSGQKVFCAKVELSANAPDVGSNESPISAYSLILLNPDIVDPNPADTYMTNMSLITYVPAVQGIDPVDYSVLWDGECLTNPDTVDFIGCRLIGGGYGESRLQVTGGVNSLLFVAQDSLPNGKNIVGTTSNSVKMFAFTGAIQLDGGTPFWLVDTTTAIFVVHENQSGSTITSSFVPPSGSVQECVNGDGTISTSGKCSKSYSPSSNICRLSIKPSPNSNIADEYRVYRSETNDASVAVGAGAITTVTSNLDSVNTYDDTISDLEGKTYYYFFSAYDSGSGLETQLADMIVGQCTVEDWVAPDPPSTPLCATPDGNYGKCLCAWTADTVSDPSLRKFKVLRDSDELTSTLPAALGESNYSYTDADASLTLGQSYTYSVSAIDDGNNESTPVTASCVPEDLQAPSKVGDFSAFNVSGLTTLDADIKWSGVEDADADYYNVYKCNNASIGTSCVTFPHANWIQSNASPIDHLGADVEHDLAVTDVPDTGDKNFEGNYCFWIQACDNCVTAGTCDSTEPNCSGFNTLPANRICIDITNVPDALTPATPQNVAAEPLPEGGKCKLTWDKVTTQSTGAPFDNTTIPTNMDLDKYAIMRAPSGETLGTNPFLIAPVGTANKSANPSYTDEGLSNGTLYQYYVISYDSNGNFSDPQSTITTCAPADVVAPDAPEVSLVLGNGDTTCDLSWAAVADDDALTYSVHRCDKAASSCMASDFPSGWGDNLGVPYVDIADLELSDTDVDLTSNSYTYCVTAKDPSDNESDILNRYTTASTAVNCAMCSTAVQKTANPPTGVTAAAYGALGSNYGVKINYTNSTSYGSNGNDGGHNIYYCADFACSSKTKISASLETADYSSTSYDKSDLGLAAGSYYFGVSYENSFGTESPVVVSGAVTLDEPVVPDDPCAVASPPASCNITITISGKYVEKKLAACNNADAECKTGTVKPVEAPFEGSVVQIRNASTGAVVKETSLGTDGSVPEIIVDSASEVSPGAQYKVVLHVPAASYTGLYGMCENSSTASSEGCDIVISAAQELTANSTITGTAKSIAKVRLVAGESSSDVFIGGGGDIGNANGDGVVNIYDLAAIKPAYNKNTSSQCYRAWADFNLDGNINIFDLTVLKANYNKTIPMAPGETLEPSLVKDNYPYKGTDDECCETGTCE